MGLLQRSSLRFKEFSLGRLVVGSSLIKKKEQLPKWSLVLTRCTTSCHSLSLVVPFFVTRCTTRSHSLSLVVIRCHSLYHSLSLAVTRSTTRLPFYKRSQKLDQKKKIPAQCFLVNSAKFLITPFLKNSLDGCFCINTFRLFKNDVTHI